LKLEANQVLIDSISTELKQTNQKLVEALQTRTNVIYGVSHELRNPLNSILGNVELVYSNLCEGRNKEQLKTAMQSGKLLLYLINNLLDAAKVEYTGLAITPASTEMKPFLDHLWLTTKILIERNNLVGRLYISKKFPKLLNIDSHRIMQVAYNLVGNAVKFTRKGYVHMLISWVPVREGEGDSVLKPITNYNDTCNDDTEETCYSFDEDSFDDGCRHKLPKISTPTKSIKGIEHSGSWQSNFEKYRTQKPGSSKPSSMNLNETLAENEEGMLKIEIIDSGCGMTKAELKELFKKFTQVGEENERKLGSGLGLWISKHLCVEMQGELKAFSKAGLGSTFIATAKAKIPRVSVSEEFTALPETLNNLEEEHKSLNVLIVDDSSEQVVEDLKKYAINISSICRCTNEAFNLFKQKERKCDVIVLSLKNDWQHFVMKVREWEREHQQHPISIAVILDSGSKFLRRSEFVQEESIFVVTKANLSEYTRLIQNLVQAKIKRWSSQPELFKREEEPLKIHMLVVDDDCFNRKLLGDFLLNNGIRCTFATNGEDAVEKVMLEHETLNLILMDCGMPVLDGFQATERINKFFEENNIPPVKIVGVTANVGPEYYKKCIHSGMTNVLVKPINFQIFKHLIRQYE
jgi:signal transduction histidine kinase/CheY-like chemotaxis protein